MPLAEIRGGAKVEIPDLAEIDAVLGARVGPEARQQWWAEQQAIQRQRDLEEARGIKYLRRSTPLSVPATTHYTATDGIAAQPGYAWSVRLLSATLASAGTFLAWITSDTATVSTVTYRRRMIAADDTSSIHHVFTFSKGAVVLFGDEGLYMMGGQNIQVYSMSVVEVPAEMLYKVID